MSASVATATAVCASDRRLESGFRRSEAPRVHAAGGSPSPHGRARRHPVPLARSPLRRASGTRFRPLSRLIWRSDGLRRRGTRSRVRGPEILVLDPVRRFVPVSAARDIQIAVPIHVQNRRALGERSEPVGVPRRIARGTVRLQRHEDRLGRAGSMADQGTFTGNPKSRHHHGSTPRLVAVVTPESASGSLVDRRAVHLVWARMRRRRRKTQRERPDRHSPGRSCPTRDIRYAMRDAVARALPPVT